MTTIVGDWNRKVLVADSQFSDDDAGIKYFEEKVFAIEGGWLGIAGSYADADIVLEYLEKKGKVKPKLHADTSLFKLTKDGLFVCGDNLEWERVRTHMAIGSGAMSAETCMRIGYTAEESVTWACNVDLKSHTPVRTYQLNSDKGIIYEVSNT